MALTHVRPGRSDGSTPVNQAVSRILLATAGKSASASAVRVARALAARHGAQVEVLSVFEPQIPYPSAPASATPQPIAPADHPDAAIQLAAVRRQLSECGGETAEWPIRLEPGHAAWCICREAERVDADLIVLGIGRSDPTVRPLGDRAAVGVALSSRVPILAVVSGFSGTARRMALAVGLDDTIVGAARAASLLLPSPGAAHLVHVQPRAGSAGSRERVAGGDTRIVDQFTRVRHALALPPDRPVEAVLLEGEVVEELLAFARTAGVDLIVGGVHGGTIHERAHIRNAAMRILSESECSVLVVPE